MRILSVVGARPQFIKAAMVYSGGNLMYVVAEGETVDQMVPLYNTTPKVLQVINLTTTQPIFYPNRPVVIVIGETVPKKGPAPGDLV